MALGYFLATPVFEGRDDDGLPLDGGLLYTYVAGTTTPQAAYTDSALVVPHANPIVLDGSGRATIYLDPDLSYALALKTSLGAAVWSMDPVQVAVTPAAPEVMDVAGVSGEALSAGDAVCISDGSTDAGGAGQAGRWVRMDADFAARSTTPTGCGFVQAAATGAGEAITVRVGGIQGGFAGLTLGADYYASATAGAVTVTAPSSFQRILGRAVSSTEVLVKPEDAPGVYQTVTYDGGNFTVPTGTITIQLAGQITYRWKKTGKQLHIILAIANGQIAGATAAYITVALPPGMLTAAFNQYGNFWYQDNATQDNGLVVASAGQGTIDLYTKAATNWQIQTGLYLRVNITLELA